MYLFNREYVYIGLEILNQNVDFSTNQINLVIRTSFVDINF